MTDILLLDDVAARALASIILERTADVIGSGGEAAASALDQLNGDTGLPPDVCAAILTATAWLAGAGGLDAEAVYAAALAHQPDDDETLTPAATGPSDAPESDPGAPGANEASETVTGPSSGQSDDVAPDEAPGDDDEAMRAAIKAAQDAAAAAIARLSEVNDAPES